jgi:hypothetical protein
LFNGTEINPQSYKARPHITTDYLSFPSRTRCPFTNYMLTKPDDYGQKCWLEVDVDSECLLNGFQYLGKDEYRPDDQLVSYCCVMSSMQPFRNKDINITADNYFTFLQLARMLKKKYTISVGAVKK